MRNMEDINLENQNSNKELQSESIENKKPKRSVSFTIVLLLSMIGSSFSVLSNLATGASHAIITKLMVENGMQLPESLTSFYSSMLDIPPDYFNEMISRMLDTPQYYFFLNAFFQALSLLGAILMWNFRKTGFHCYTLAQLILLLLPAAFLGKAYIGVGDIMLTILFIAFYALNIFKRNISQDVSKQ